MYIRMVLATTMMMMMMMMRLATLTAAAAAATATATTSSSSSSSSGGMEQQQQQPDKNSMQLLLQQEHAAHRTLASASSSSSSVYAESTSTYYDGYQQAWRMLGVYVDCGSGSGSGDEQHNDENNNNNAATGPSYCERSVLWAAYVDLNYQGGSIGEYQYSNWDATSSTTTTSTDGTTTTTTSSSYNAWDTSACELTGNQRCAKMDCHLTSSDTWTLLGIYKEAAYGSEWFEQLFKHAGYCLWQKADGNNNDNNRDNDSSGYNFMKNYYDTWPEGCTATNSADPSTGNTLYVDLKPGQMLAPALYTDSICYTEYRASAITEEAQAAIISETGYLTGDTLATFNQNMQAFKTCQPCRAYNLLNTDQDDRRRRLQQRNQQQQQHRHVEDSDPNYPLFACYDDAGYTNVNQCMKFRSKTEMVAASWKDVETALLQGAIVDVKLANGRVHESPRKALLVLQQQQAAAAAIAAAQAASTGDSSATSLSSMSTTTQRTGQWLLLSAVICLSAALVAFWVVLAWKLQRRRNRRAARKILADVGAPQPAFLKEPLVRNLASF